MTAMPDVATEAPKKGSKLPLLIGLVLALAGGGGGFFAASSGLLPFGKAEAATAEESVKPEAVSPELLPQFVALDPMVISLPPGARRAHLRFAAQLEVAPEALETVTAIQPRIVDVLNGYLRAVDLADLEDPAALMRLRAQMLRRVQIVAGEGKVKDLLIMEFVLS